MGLTIHYRIRSAAATADEARAQVARIQQLAGTLPFDQVDDALVDLEGARCDFVARRDELSRGSPPQQALLWLLIQASTSIAFPWNRHIRLRVRPTRVIGFGVLPGPGSESAEIGLAQYPAEIPVTYAPRDDRRFQETVRQGSSTTWQFSERKWRRWCHSHALAGSSPDEARFQETRRVATGMAGWSWSSFCKTQYASDPASGGVANFLRCHIGLVTLLDQVGKLPGVRVRVNDEGRYGRSCYSDDPTVARPVYTWHHGSYSPAALTKEVGVWNEFMAAAADALRDAAGNSGSQVQAPILSYASFQELTFRGRRRKEVRPFLEAMKRLAERSRRPT